MARAVFRLVRRQPRNLRVCSRVMSSLFFPPVVVVGCLLCLGDGAVDDFR